MKHARVLLVENEPNIVKLASIRLMISAGEHSLDAVATSREEFDQKWAEILNLPPDERPNVVVTDANLERGIYDGEDGAHVVQQAKLIGAFTIGISSGSFHRDYGIAVDIDAGKDAVRYLDKVIDGIDEPDETEVA